MGTDPNIRCEVTPNFDIVSAILPAGCVKHTFVISQEIASCEIKSLRQDAQLAEKKPARARNKSCAAKAVAREVCEAHFCSNFNEKY